MAPQERTRRPWASGGLVAAILAGFAAELTWATTPSSGAAAPDLTTLVTFGGAGRLLLTEHGEWWRLFTAAFVHGSLPHLLLNALALAVAARIVERTWGAAWTLAVFFAGGCAGAALAVLLNPTKVLSVGASGAIMALAAAALVGSARLPAGRSRTRDRIWLAAILVPALAPIAVHGAGGPRIDYAAHLGGALAGLVPGALLAVAPGRLRALGVAAALAGAAATLVGFGHLTLEHSRIAEAAHAAGRSGLIPDAELPEDDAAALAAAESLGERYPNDPRAHLFLARLHRSRGALRPAEGELRVALSMPALYTRFPAGRLEMRIRTELALLLLADGRREQARQDAAKVCAKAPARAQVAAEGLCDEDEH